MRWHRLLVMACWVAAGCSLLPTPDADPIDPAWIKPAAHLKRAWSDVEQRDELSVSSAEEPVSLVECLTHTLSDLQFPEGNARVTFGMSPEHAARHAGGEHRPWVGCLLVIPAGLPVATHWRYQDQIAHRVHKVEVAYWSLDKARAIEAWTLEMRDFVQSQRENARIRRDQQSATDIDVMGRESEWELWNQRVALARVGSPSSPGVLQANMVLREACGWPRESNRLLCPSDPFHPLRISSDSWEHDLALALRQRCDLLAARSAGLAYRPPSLEKKVGWKNPLPSIRQRERRELPGIIETSDTIQRAEEQARLELAEVRQRVGATWELMESTHRATAAARHMLKAALESQSAQAIDADQVTEARKKLSQATHENKIARDDHQIALAEYEWRRGTNLQSAGIIVYNEINGHQILLGSEPIGFQFGPQSVELIEVEAEGAEPVPLPASPTPAHGADNPSAE